MLNKKKGHGAASLPNPNPAGLLNAVDNNETSVGVEDPPGPSNGPNSGDGTLLGLEDLADGTNDDGIPFILVDGATCTSRSHLDLALRGVEQRRWEQVVKDVESSSGVHFIGDDKEPPPELNMDINLSPQALAEKRAVEEELRFQQDIRDLTFWPPEADDTPATTSHKENTSTEATPELKHMRGSPKKVSRSGTEKLLKLPDHPVLQRQDTFDIKRMDEGPAETSTVEAATSKKPQSLKPPYSGGIPCPARRKQPEMTPEKAYTNVRARQITNRIGELIVELCSLDQQKSHAVLSEGSSYSYLVTISPDGGASNCSIQPIKSSSNTVPHPKRAKSDPKSNIIGRNSLAPTPFKQASSVAYPEERPRSQFLNKSPPYPFLKIPTPSKYCQGRKRD